VAFEATGKPLIIYSAFAKYLRKNGNTMNKFIGFLWTSSNLIIQLGGSFGIPRTRVSLKKMSMNENYGGVWVVKNVSYRFPIRNGLRHGDTLRTMLFNFALVYAIRRVQVNQCGLKVFGTHQLLAFSDDVNILGGS